MSMASETLKSGSRSIMYKQMLALKVMYLHTNSKSPAYVMWKPHRKSVTDERADRWTGAETKMAKPMKVET